MAETAVEIPVTLDHFLDILQAQPVAWTLFPVSGLQLIWGFRKDNGKYTDLLEAVAMALGLTSIRELNRLMASSDLHDKIWAAENDFHDADPNLRNQLLIACKLEKEI